MSATLVTWLLLVFVFLVFSTCGVAAQDATEISNAQELQDIREDLDGDYVLVDDINASGYDFEPMGVFTGGPIDGFSGSLNGNGHSISNLRIDRPNESDVGVFGAVVNGSVEDVRLKNVNVVGDENVGGLAGTAFGADTRISDVYVSGEISGNKTIGGVVGNSLTLVNASESAADVTGVERVGGVVGHGNAVVGSNAIGDVTGEEGVGGLAGSSLEVRKSYATGDVTGKEGVGGLIGTRSMDLILFSAVDFEIPLISESYATGDVSGESAVGGLAAIGSRVNGSYATGDVSGEGAVGGLVGFNLGYINESYATGDVSGETRVGGLAGGTVWRVTESYATGDVRGEENVGGLAGIALAEEDTPVANSILNASYATGDVTGERSVGGLLGANAGFLIEETYAAGAVTGGENVGGLVGEDVQELPDRDEEVADGEVESSYWDIEATGQDESAGGTGLATDEMTGSAARDNMDGFDFEETWRTTEDDYPSLAWQVDDAPADEERLPGFGVVAALVAVAVFSVTYRRYLRI